jgi:hypothetical protein
MLSILNHDDTLPLNKKAKPNNGLAFLTSQCFSVDLQKPHSYFRFESL